MAVLLVASVFALVDTDASIRSYVDQGGVRVNHQIPNLLNSSAVPPGSEWGVQSVFRSLAVCRTEELPPYRPDLWGGVVLSWVVEDGGAGWVY